MGTTLDIFDRTKMTKMFTESKVPTMWLVNKFFSNPNSVTEMTAGTKVIIDKVNEIRYKSGYTKRGQEAILVGRAGYDTSSHTPPFINEKILYDFENDSVRVAGNVPFGGSVDSADQAVGELRKNTEELKRRFMRELEFQAASAMMNGKIVVDSGEEFDFGLLGTHKVTASPLWTGSSPTILTNLSTAASLNAKDGGLPSNTIIMGNTAWNAAIKDEKFLAQFNQQRIAFGNLTEPRYEQDNRVSWKGVLNLDGASCDVWLYEQWYFDGSDTVKYINDKKVWIGSDMARFDKYFAGIFDAKAGRTFKGEYIIDQFIQEDPDGIYTRLRSAPLLVPVEINSFSILTITS